MSTNADKNWKLRAACWDCPPGLFFPENTPAQLELKEQAKQICRNCEVRVQCLRFALETRQERGIWGGKDENELARLRRRRDRIEIVLFERGR
jgi:WhiB family redox-sensing transcriptional regulator